MAAWSSATTAEPAVPLRIRAGEGLRRRRNWLQLAKFCLVGTSGYAVNLVVFGALLGSGVDFRLAAVGAFVVAVSNNYSWNRLWTFRDQRGHVAYQGARFLAVSLVVLGANLGALSVLVLLGAQELPAQALAVVMVTPLNFLGNKLWSFGPAAKKRGRNPAASDSAPWIR